MFQFETRGCHFKHLNSSVTMPALQTTSTRVAAVPGRTRSAGLAAKIGPNFRPSMVKTAKGLFQTRLNAESYGVFELNYKADKVRVGVARGAVVGREASRQLSLFFGGRGQGSRVQGAGCRVRWVGDVRGPSIRPSVHPSIRPSVDPSIRSSRRTQNSPL